ncbi:MAG TPA: KedN5 family methylcobalamin-dependent radical SAM C-methyltransferase [Kofleriaceae bacterium]|nr:KedN5 family methylcobalamin-dependent radical SAM C-methyltransferase [Kofleriaceae bacterium]
MSSTRPTRKKIWLVQRSVWAMETESMPLASGYFKALVDADPVLSSELDIQIFNFSGGHSTLEMAQTLFLGDHGMPDVVAFSVFGWNYNPFGKLAEMFKQLRPDGWAIFGGTHVAKQGTRTFAMYPQVDVVVDGEGELTFLDLMRALLAGTSRHGLDDILGITFKRDDGTVVTNAERPRMMDLDIIPSPLLTGTLKLRHPDGRQKYDVVLLETNRGCPYTCSFCYWGGATGQKVRKFSTDRIAAELELAGREGIAEVVLCDSNFGMFKEDEEFVETVIKMREKYGFPRSFETSWAKNKSKTFFSIVERMKSVGLRSSFTLALQTLSDPALVLMKRKNMKVNDWRELAAWLKQQGLACYSELIWGTPGETCESFLEGYAALSEHVSRIAVYPLLIMPNTDYSESRKEHGFVLLRGDKDDFEYVIANKTMSYEDNKRMHRFIFWARVVAENQIFRYIWGPLRLLEGIGQVEVLQSLDSWFSTQTDGISRGLLACRAEMVDNLDASRVTRGIHYFYLEDQLPQKLLQWWRDEILSKVKEENRHFFEQLFQYDLVTRPVYRPSNVRVRSKGDLDLETVEINQETFYVRRGFTFDYDIPTQVSRILAGEPHNLARSEREVTLYYRQGFATHIDNHEFVSRYVGLTRAQIDAEHAPLHVPAKPAVAEPAAPARVSLPIAQG